MAFLHCRGGVALLIVSVLTTAHCRTKEGVVQMEKDGKATKPHFDKEDTEEFSLYEQESLQAYSTYSNGDIRLVSNTATCLTPTSGRLEVHMNTLLAGRSEEDEDGEAEITGEWGSVCGMGFTITEANVACRQLGFAAAWKFELSSQTGDLANQSAPIFLEGVRCSKRDLSHLMRCRSTSPTFLNCTHNFDVTVHCNSTKLWANPYRGQVRLVNENSTSSVSSGRVEVFQTQLWGTVCNREFSQAAADTVCRQLGFTNAVSISDANPGEGLVWVDSISCDSSAPCFKSCYKAHRWSHECNHTLDVAVQCTYDLSLALENTAGSRSKCRIGIFPVSMLVLAIMLSLSALLGVGCVGVIVFSSIRCCMRRRKYSPRNYDSLG